MSFLPYIQYTVISNSKVSTELIQRQSFLFIQAFKVVQGYVEDKPVIKQQRQTKKHGSQHFPTLKLNLVVSIFQHQHNFL